MFGGSLNGNFVKNREKDTDAQMHKVKGSRIQQLGIRNIQEFHVWILKNRRAVICISKNPNIKFTTPWE
jgi:hypothetical protein